MYRGVLLAVISCHIALVAIGRPQKSPNHPPPLLVERTRLVQPKRPPPPPLPPPPPKPVVAKRSPQQARRPEKRAKKIAKIELKSDNQVQQKAPPLDKVERREDHHDLLMALLRDHLILPEQGDVTLVLRLGKEGGVADMRIIAKESETNAAYLTTHLPTLDFPPSLWGHERTIMFSSHYGGR